MVARKFTALFFLPFAFGNGTCRNKDEVALRVSSRGGRFELFDKDERPTVGSLRGPEDQMCVKASTCTKLNVFATDSASVTVSDGKGQAQECQHHECYFHVCATDTHVSTLTVRTLDSMMEHHLMSEEDFELPTLKHEAEKKAPKAMESPASVERMRDMFEQVRNLQGVTFSYDFDTNCVSSGVACGEDAHCPDDEYCYIPVVRKKKRALRSEPEDEAEAEAEHGRGLKFGSNIGGTCICT